MEDNTVALTQEVWGELIQSYRGIKVWKWFEIILNNTSTQSLVTLTLCEWRSHDQQIDSTTIANWGGKEISSGTLSSQTEPEKFG